VAGAVRASFVGRDYLRGKIRDCSDEQAERSRERSGMAPHLRLRHGAVWRKKKMAVKFFSRNMPPTREKHEGALT